MIMESRRRGTSLLAEALAHCKMKPKVFISASGVGYYGNGGDAVLTEASPKGTGFLSEVASVWEEKTAAAAAAGIRTVNLRFGVILSRNGGALRTFPHLPPHPVCPLSLLRTPTFGFSPMLCCVVMQSACTGPFSSA
ncbi:hypothetical protein EON62_02940, partial [archaeon]